LKLPHEAKVSADLKGRIPELDGIRGIAIGMVLLHHYFLLPIRAEPGTAWSYLQAAGRLAWSGVDLFFVLSGFLIGGILLDARTSENYFRVFYTRRFFRIVPIYACCLAGAYVLKILVGQGLAPRLAWMFARQVPFGSYVAFLQNFWMAGLTTYGIFGLGVTWSLAIEEQFYLTLPALIRLINPKRLVVAVSMGIALAPLLRTALYVFWRSHPMSWVVLMPCRADALLLGVLGAIALRNSAVRQWFDAHRGVLRMLLVALAVGVGPLTVRWSNPYGGGMATVGFTWLALFYLAVLLCAVLYSDSWVAQMCRWRWLGWLGSIAYGTYLLHEFVRSLLFGLIWSRLPTGMSAAEFGVSVAALICTLALCWASWVFFERPLIERGHAAQYQRSPNGAVVDVANPKTGMNRGETVAFRS
jgi:peptidoglycan/LPS O-acetylase OafA/YrhL